MSKSSVCKSQRVHSRNAMRILNRKEAFKRRKIPRGLSNYTIPWKCTLFGHETLCQFPNTCNGYQRKCNIFNGCHSGKWLQRAKPFYWFRPFIFYIYAFFQNASYARYASYKSSLLVTSYGECIESTGTPQSITSIPLFARIYAIVPPPPISTFPNSDIW